MLRMTARISNIGRRIFTLKGFLVHDVCLSSRNVHSFTSKVSSNLALPRTFIPPLSADVKEVTFYDKNNFSRILPLQLSSPRLQILDKPVPVYKSIITELPLIKTNITYEDKLPDKEIEDPKPLSYIEKHAIRMIVIRRRKMRVHKRKKWRKKMKFVIAKYQQKKRTEKEKVFQAELMAQIKEAEKFDAAVYVKEKIRKADEEQIPKRWRGKRLPEFIIRDLLERKKKKSDDKQAKFERRKNMNVKASDYK